MQTRMQSLFESFTNIFVGFLVGFFANHFILPLFGYDVSLSDNLLITCAFTVISIARSYLLRRFFNKHHTKPNSAKPDMLDVVFDWEYKTSGRGARRFDAALLCRSAGYQLEELAEKLEAMRTGNPRIQEAIRAMRRGKHVLVSGHCTPQVRQIASREELLHEDLDLLWVTLGSLCHQGANARGAFDALVRANFAKIKDGLTTDVNGKIIKPAGWEPADLTRFTCLRKV